MPDLLEGTGTNYISMNFSNGLLYCCLSEAYGFLKGPIDMLTLYENKYNKKYRSLLTSKLVEDEEMTILMALFEYQSTQQTRRR
jgi:hypothetical protein